MTNQVKRNLFYGILVALSVLVIVMIILGSRTVSTSAESNLDEMNRYYETYEVQSSDTLWNLAAENADKYGIPTREYLETIKTLNQLTTDKLVPGNKILLVQYE